MMRMRLPKKLNFSISTARSVSPRVTPREAGDLARDRQDWAGAATNYLTHLETWPDDAPIWVQLGHAHKETGNYVEAEAAYRQGVVLTPDNADAHLQLGHLLKTTGRRGQAAPAYMQALLLNRSKDAWRELREIGYGDEAAALLAEWGGRPTRRCLDISDLLITLETHTTVTGISRVQIGLLFHVFDMQDDEAMGTYDFVFQNGDRSEALLAPKPVVQAVLRAAGAGRVDAAALAALVRRCRADGVPVDWQAGDLYFVPGTFWTATSNPTFIPALKAQGVRYGAYIYDLIPITHPQFCEAGLTESFMVALAESVPFFDFVLTISGFISKEITSFVAQNGLRQFPALPAPLAHELKLQGVVELAGITSLAAKRLPASRRSRLPDALQGRRFVLCVGTIEARKNHVYLFYVWQRLLEEGVDVPDLVLVGQYGWRIADLRAQLQASRFLDGRIHVLNGVPDADLAVLYQECMFTIFPSFVEGWGLPVGESLSRGKVPVASFTSSIPEVGGEFAIYIDPFNLHSGLDVVRRLIVDDQFRASAEAAIRERFVPRTWRAAGAHFFAQIEAGLAGLTDAGIVPPVYAPRLAAGRLLNISDLQRPTDRLFDYLRRPLRLMLVGGWRPVDIGGAWIKDRAAALRFATDCPANTEIVVFMKFAAVPWVADNTLIARSSEHSSMPGHDSPFEARRVLAAGEMFWQTVRAVVDADGVASVQLRIEGTVRANPPDEESKVVNLCLRQRLESQV